MKFLIVIDMQRDFIDGALGTKEAASILPKVIEKIKGFSGKIIATMDTHQGNYMKTQEGHMLPVPHCIKLTEGWELNNKVSEFIKNSGNPYEIYMKPTFGSVDMASNLAGVYDRREEPIEEIVLVGLCTDICVVSNALLLKAFMPEVKITVDAACCAGVTTESHAAALKTMQMCQINIENWGGLNHDFGQSRTHQLYTVS